MRSLFLLWGCLVLPGYGSLVGPKEISGFEGDTVSLRCTYGEELKKFQKYWCRNAGLLLNRCSNRVYATEDGREKTVGKVSIQDSRHERTLKVTLRGISMQDAGQYWCGVQKLGFDNSVLISLLVFPASSGRHPAVSTAKTGIQAPPLTGGSPHDHEGASSPSPGTSPSAGPSPHAHAATSPPAGTSRPTARLDPPTAEDPSSSDISPLRTLVPTARTLAPVLVLISLLLATGLAALLTRYVFPWRKEAVLEDPPKDTEDEKVQLSHMTSEENQASPLDAQGDLVPGIPLQVPGEESGFVPV
ncbi:CMRF35-like molecule 9 isoform X2 [Sorex fumeus]|uniref:CMRF35-like molecule 9 isoform X2 n=1 Tax=Sorex fumeus TaxID=62283 RepID=UPI0024AC8710|nr:CMRF35-like molecule 9 isoform X2 [Sorex fumeus]